MHCACPNHGPQMLAAPLEVDETNWKCLHPSASSLPEALLRYFHQPNSPWIPVANQAIHAIYLFLLLSIHYFDFRFSFFVDSRSGSHRGTSFVPPLLSDTGVSTPLLSDTESPLADVDSCDEDDDEADEGAVEEELAVIPGTTNGT